MYFKFKSNLKRTKHKSFLFYPFIVGKNEKMNQITMRNMSKALE